MEYIQLMMEFHKIIKYSTATFYESMAVNSSKQQNELSRHKQSNGLSPKAAIKGNVHEKVKFL